MIMMIIIKLKSIGRKGEEQFNSISSEDGPTVIVERKERVPAKLEPTGCKLESQQKRASGGARAGNEGLRSIVVLSLVILLALFVDCSINLQLNASSSSSSSSVNSNSSLSLGQVSARARRTTTNEPDDTMLVSSDTSSSSPVSALYPSTSLPSGPAVVIDDMKQPEVVVKSPSSGGINTSAIEGTDLANGSADQADNDQSLRMGVIIANFIIFIIGLCGNTIVILVIVKFTRIETVTDIYILNLAFADLMFIMGLIFLITTMLLQHWIFGNLMCKIYMATTSLNQFASSLLLVVMSFDRFLAVCHPIYAQRFRHLKRAKIICFTIWIICLILMTPIFAFAKIDQEAQTCAIFWPEYQSFNCEVAFTLYSFAIGFAVPLLLIACFYLCVIRKLRRSAKGPISKGNERRCRVRETANRRIEHLVIGIIFTYTICWLPYWLTQLLVSFSAGEKSPIVGFYTILLIASCLSYTNSALNPILYAFLSDNFKRRCSEILRSIYSFKFFHRKRPTNKQKQKQKQKPKQPAATTTATTTTSAASAATTTTSSTALTGSQSHYNQATTALLSGSDSIELKQIRRQDKKQSASCKNESFNRQVASDATSGRLMETNSQRIGDNNGSSDDDNDDDDDGGGDNERGHLNYENQPRRINVAFNMKHLAARGENVVVTCKANNQQLEDKSCCQGV